MSVFFSPKELIWSFLSVQNDQIQVWLKLPLWQALSNKKASKLASFFLSVKRQETEVPRDASCRDKKPTVQEGGLGSGGKKLFLGYDEVPCCPCTRCQTVPGPAGLSEAHGRMGAARGTASFVHYPPLWKELCCVFNRQRFSLCSWSKQRAKLVSKLHSFCILGLQACFVWTWTMFYTLFHLTGMLQVGPFF